jgi:ABC-2 type transport system permease protein
MKTIFLFDIKSYLKLWGFYVILVLMILLGILAGEKARFSISEDIYQNSAYQISFIATLTSLTTFFFSTIFASQLLFKEADARFELLIFNTPITKSSFVSGRFLSLFLLSFSLLLVLMVSFFIGHAIGLVPSKSTNFVLMWYVYPIVLFGLINTLFTTAILSFVAWFTRNKLMVYVTGLMLYIIYMVAMIYSGSPLMAQSLPQSEEARLIAAIADPFGFSAWFHQTAQWSVSQRNSSLVSISGIFLVNRIWVICISLLLIAVSMNRFSFHQIKSRRISKTKIVDHEVSSQVIYKPIATQHGLYAWLQRLLSFVRIDLIYVIKSIPFMVTSLALLFLIGMEMYAEIEKGIRIPQKYASSGLMVSTIIQNFHVLCMIVMLYYANEIFWRSRQSNFNLIEDTANTSNVRFFSQCFSISIIVLIFSVLMILEGIFFQISYGYRVVEWKVYGYVFLFNSFPLMLLSVIVLLIQQLSRNRYIGLALTSIVAFALATTLFKGLFFNPLMKFLLPFKGDYSDFNGFGTYDSAYANRLLFGLMVVSIFVMLSQLRRKNILKWQLIGITALIFIVYATGITTIKGYRPKNEDSELASQANYEHTYRKYQDLPQPSITDVTTTVDLFPEQNSYCLRGKYLLENKSTKDITKILINFADDFLIKKAKLMVGSTAVDVTSQYQVISLKTPLSPHQKAYFTFEIDYGWKAVNGHESFNAIIENGSFMRISRYYPTFGYLPENEISDSIKRKQYNLGMATPTKSFDAPKVSQDFINLDMVVSTAAEQTAIGIGELISTWKSKGRNYFRYQTGAPIPFRFALSSANYAIKKEIYKGKKLEIFYHPQHSENVLHLLKNVKLTMDYCEANFGPYPFQTIRFAEVSSFTKGFAATAYPTTIYMTEDLIFHSNIKSDRNQDVINELAGHELSHLWWGCNQISPDIRPGATMLTETFAMYTEMMLLKQMYGKKEMLERVKMHMGIYLDSRGYEREQPLYKVENESRHISYSKGTVIMYQLSELIGEGKVNLALKNFLERNKYPHQKPISRDFINEIYRITATSLHPKIDEMFMKTGLDEWLRKLD